MMKPGRVLLLIALAALVFGGTFAVISLTRGAGLTASEISEERALEIMERLYKRIKVNTLPQVKENVDLEPVNVADSLPDISKYPLQVSNSTSDFVEIFSSAEKATIASGSTDTDRWLVDVAENFNDEGLQVNGRTVSVALRGMASGAAMDYITTGKYVPDAYTPSNSLWGDSLKARGIPVTLVEERLAGNVAGIVISKEKHAAIIEKYGAVSMNTVVEAVAANDLTMGYTNPFTSSTGINFLMSTLFTFDSANPMSDTSVQAFERFQTNIPFVAYTTLQMKESAQSGVLEGFVFESQLLSN
ncbi:MAG: substrate-binding domain-containing protein, partial [Clostridiales bacterium]|nr:substrate-binding domain-containing protein [Clostridiales bacterium]